MDNPLANCHHSFRTSQERPTSAPQKQRSVRIGTFPARRPSSASASSGTLERSGKSFAPARQPSQHASAPSLRRSDDVCPTSAQKPGSEENTPPRAERPSSAPTYTSAAKKKPTTYLITDFAAGRGAACGEPATYALQSQGPKVLYRRPSSVYGSFYGDPRRQADAPEGDGPTILPVSAATEFPLREKNLEFTKLYGIKGHAATRTPGKHGFYRDESLWVKSGCKMPSMYDRACKDWIWRLNG
eukprot:TRINITY_DN26293_c0_g1_i2.p1 TRINITY_DN26293_c0_g1~~TRINITY_DN26293_c0_g1_i2.p1  ORF type:complete len:259 (+),score=31.30 TRINITY_DN26293_c0_g1_i2:50-778(+)